VEYTDLIVAYPLSQGVRARREEFGLLFYNSMDTNLTFVKCGNLLKVNRTSEGAFELCLASVGKEAEKKARGYIVSLQKKGLVGEPSPCI
jgi:putative mycofactocin binding protein MftB